MSNNPKTKSSFYLQIFNAFKQLQCLKVNTNGNCGLSREEKNNKDVSNLHNTSKVPRRRYLPLKICTKINTEVKKHQKPVELGIWLKKLGNEEQNKLKENRRNITDKSRN